MAVPVLKDISLSSDKPPMRTPILLFLSVAIFLILSHYLQLGLKHNAPGAVNPVPYKGHQGKDILCPGPAGVDDVIRVYLRDLRPAHALALEPGLFYEPSGRSAVGVFEYGAGVGEAYCAGSLAPLPELGYLRFYLLRVPQFECHVGPGDDSALRDLGPSVGKIKLASGYETLLPLAPGYLYAFDDILHLAAVGPGVHCDRSADRTRYVGG